MTDGTRPGAGCGRGCGQAWRAPRWWGVLRVCEHLGRLER
jgi:hypothetical protein